ncbi:hypothetical protein AKG98_2635 [Moritella sp. JT01]|uniref:hypothetical protein n=1 Tax=Moritella sp. JT01 TaxID=756698 RepID=UPI000797C773|nr:hypothetical protein [Moritella sp. JT01]KXO07282.1 hypothetical protein AKG98_2635 [Moritella sp. JT01]
MKAKSLYSLLLSGVIALSVAGCSSSSVKRNADQEFPLEVTTSAPAFIFPISLHGVPGDSAEVGLAISSGAVAEYGTSVISGQQLYSVVGNLSWTLGENMRRQASLDKLEMTGSAEKYAIELDKKMKTLTSKLKASGVLTNKDYNFKYVIVLHVDSSGGMNIPMMTNVTAFGGVMDMETRKIVSYIEKDLTLSQDAILAQMPIEMNKIIAELLDKPEDA